MLAHMCRPVRQLVAIRVSSMLVVQPMNVSDLILFVNVVKVDSEDARLLVRPAVGGQCTAGHNWVAHWVVSPGCQVRVSSLRGHGSGLRGSSKVLDDACMSVRL